MHDGLAESSAADERVLALEARVRQALQLPGDHRVHFADLHDALTSMRFHGKALPPVRYLCCCCLACCAPAASHPFILMQEASRPS